MANQNDRPSEPSVPKPNGPGEFGFEGKPKFSSEPTSDFWGQPAPFFDVGEDGKKNVRKEPESNPERPLFSDSPAFVDQVDVPPKEQKVQPGHHPAPSGTDLVPLRPGEAVRNEDSDFSYDVQEIMAKPPHWLLRCGISVIALVIATVLFMTWLIRYPDTISGVMTISGTSPAVQVVARENGNLAELHVKEGDSVEKDQVLAIIESPAESDRVFAIKAELTKLIPFLSDPSRFDPVELSAEANLGTLQSSYSEFLSGYIAFQSLMEDDYVDRTVSLLSEQIEHQKRRVDNMKAQVEDARRALELSQEKYSRMAKLHQRGSLSTSELEEQEQGFLVAKRARAEIEKGLNAEEVSLIDLEKQVSDLKHERRESLRTSVTRLQESLKKVFSDIQIWEEQYVLKSPVAGKVAFYDFWASTQYVTTGSQVFVVAPESASLIGRMKVQGNGVGKIKKGQKVNVKFSDYAYKEFGMVTGSVQSVSLVAKEGAHLVMVSIDYPLVTNFHREIPFKQSMQADGAVVTEDLRLLERIFYQLRKAISSALEPSPAGNTAPGNSSGSPVQSA